MKTAQVIEMLKIQLEKDPNEEVIIQWWRREDMDFHIETTPQIWAEMVKIWDNEPLTGDQAGLREVLNEAVENLAIRRRKELSEKLQVIHGGK